MLPHERRVNAVAFSTDANTSPPLTAKSRSGRCARGNWQHICRGSRPRRMPSHGAPTAGCSRRADGRSSGCSKSRRGGCCRSTRIRDGPTISRSPPTDASLLRKRVGRNAREPRNQHGLDDSDAFPQSRLRSASPISWRLRSGRRRHEFPFGTCRRGVNGRTSPARTRPPSHSCRERTCCRCRPIRPSSSMPSRASP